MTSAAPFRVLIVDDEHSVADTLAMIARGAGYLARVAYSGEQATQIADELQPHATVSDVMLPGMDGLELTAWLEEHHPACTMLLMSGHPGTNDLLRPNGHPLPPILAKPFDPGDLLLFLAECAAKA